MAMNRKRGFSGAGLSTVLLVFVMLCLIVFSVLSLSTAKADLEMSRKVADGTSAYYRAQSLASERLEEIDALLAKTYNENKMSYLSAAQKALQKEDDLEVTQASDETELFCTYRISVDENRQLCVKLAVANPETGNETSAQILAWEVEQSKDWNADTGLPVLQKEPEDTEKP